MSRSSDGRNAVRNTDIANPALFAHYTGQHTDDNGNILIPPGPTFLGTGNNFNWDRSTVAYKFAGPLRSPFVGGNASSVLTITANVITPTNWVHHLGAGLVKTITVPSNILTGPVTIIPDAAFTWDTTDNIRTAGTAVIGVALTFVWDGTKWNPSYV